MRLLRSILAIGMAICSTSLAEEFHAVITGFQKADTFSCKSDDGQRHTVQLYGCYGEPLAMGMPPSPVFTAKECKEAAEKRLLGKRVKVRIQTVGLFNAIIDADVYLNDMWVNKALIEAGICKAVNGIDVELDNAEKQRKRVSEGFGGCTPRSIPSERIK